MHKTKVWKIYNLVKKLLQIVEFFCIKINTAKHYCYCPSCHSKIYYDEDGDFCCPNSDCPYIKLTKVRKGKS